MRMLVSMMTLALAVSAAGAKELKVGDAAPPLKIAEWLKGSAVDVTKGSPDQIYVVEFWATWCRPCHQSIPHLSDLQTHFADKKVTVIGVTAEEANVVKSFIRDLGEKQMRYTVAVDDDAETNKAYMEAAGVPGIPHAFIVRGGKVLWHGHPIEMDDEIVKLTGDKSWAEFKNKTEAAAKRRGEQIKKAGAAINVQKWDEAIVVLDEMLKADSQDHGALAQKYYLVLIKKKDSAGAAAVGQKLLSDVDDAVLLDNIAFSILMDDEFAPVRDPKFALALSERAVKLNGSKDAGMLCTLARAKYENGAGEEAIKIAEDALKICKDPQVQQDLEDSLKTYRAAKPTGTPKGS